jgi:hypothetical protein
LASLFLVAGCGNSKPPAANTAFNEDTNKASAVSTPVYQQPPVIAPTPTEAPNDPAPQNIHEMERVLVGWVIRNHHRPKSFEEFAASANIQVPPPPAGKKYFIAKNMHIILVNQ